MTFEGHADRAPRHLPHREQGEALLAIREASPSAPSEEGLDLFAVPAVRFRGVASTSRAFTGARACRSSRTHRSRLRLTARRTRPDWPGPVPRVGTRTCLSPLSHDHTLTRG